MVDYSRKHFQPFADKYDVELKHLMGSIIQIDSLAQIKFCQNKGLEHKATPNTQVYLDILRDDQWATLEHQFIKDYCRLQGLAPESGLLLITQASALALPKLAKVMQIIKNQ